MASVGFAELLVLLMGPIGIETAGIGGLGFPEILLIVVVAVVLLGGKKIGDLGKGLGEGVRNFKQAGRASRPRDRGWVRLLAIGLIGAVVEAARTLAFSPYLRSLNLEAVGPVIASSVLQSAIVWVLFYAGLNRYWRRRLSTNILVPSLVVWLIKTPVSMLISLAILSVSGMPASSAAYYAQSANWVRHVLGLRTAWPGLITAFLLVVCSSYVSRRENWRNRRSAATWSGYGGATMISNTNHTTRFLCASAYLGGVGFPEWVLNRFRDPTRAVAPEVGLDMPLLARVCEAALRRARNYHLLFAASAAIAFLAYIGSDSPAVVVVYVLVTAVALFVKLYRERYEFAGAFRQRSFDPEALRKRFPDRSDPEAAEALPAEGQNLIVHGGFVPFVGAGVELGGWSFSLAVDKGRESLGSMREPREFRTPELYAAIHRAVTEIGMDGLDIRDVCFVHGSDIREDKEILPDTFGRPLQLLSPERISRYCEKSDSRVRHYQWIRVRDWGNDLVVSYFLRCALRGRSLFVEIKRFLLPPVADQYRTIDSLGEADWRSVLGLFAVCLVGGPLHPILSAFSLVGKFLEAVNHVFDSEARQRERLIRKSPLYNYGAQTSLRQQLSSQRYVHYFQKLDGEFYSKVLERRILDEIVSFLEEHDIDTSDIEERRTTILNSGIIVQGGDVNAESVAVGAGAQASTSGPKRERKILRRGAGA